MTPTFTSNTEEGAYRITFGPDPRVYTVSQGSIAVMEDRVEVTFKRPLILPPINADCAMAYQRIAALPYFMVFLIGLCWSLSRMVTHPSFLTFVLWLLIMGVLLLPPLGTTVPILNRRFAFPKDTAQVRRAGRKLTLLAPGMLGTLRGITFIINTLDDARALERALCEAGVSLPAALRINTPMTPAQWHPTDMGLYHDGGTLHLTPDTVEFTGRLYSYVELQRLEIKSMARLYLIMLSVLALAITFRSLEITYHSGGWWGALSILATVLGIIAFFSYIERRKPALPERTVSYPRAAVSAVDHVEETVSFHAAGPTGKVEKMTVTFPNPEIADAVEAALCAPEILTEEQTYPTRPQPVHEYGFFGTGHLTVAGTTVTILGRHTGSGPHGARRWIPAALLYAGLAYALFTLYPVLFEEIIPAEFKGTVILMLPALIVLLLGVIVLSLIPLFVTQSRSIATTDIRNLRRLGRQITFTADYGRERYVFHLKTPEVAEAVERALGG